MSAYYNEFDPNAAAWLRQLIKNGLIADGEVDERSITDVTADDLGGFNQCHFFAGIGGWSLALRLAGVPDDYPVWTGSCPCQPFSCAGKNKGKEDERHLWPELFRLISTYKPITVFGEQVERAIKHGWLDDLSSDMEGEGYTVGAAVLGAHSAGAPHIRQRLYWVANADGDDIDRRCRAVQMGRLWSKKKTALNCHEKRTEWPAKSGVGMLAYGVPNRVEQLRGLGNAIVPQVAAAFICAFMEIAA